jgi:hypothetical protein
MQEHVDECKHGTRKSNSSSVYGAVNGQDLIPAFILQKAAQPRTSVQSQTPPASGDSRNCVTGHFNPSDNTFAINNLNYLIIF